MSKLRVPKIPVQSVYLQCRGRCFYCGLPVQRSRGVPMVAPVRDWIIVKGDNYFVREHKTPTRRGGPNDKGNLTTSCGRCNRTKDLFTIDEYRFVLGLRSGSLNYRFAQDDLPLIERDWLCAGTAAHERDLVLHNYPAAKAVYAHRRLGRVTFERREAKYKALLAQ